jgi:hypothetical protein
MSVDRAVEHPLGKGEVHSSILCGSTSNPTSSNGENNGNFKLLPIARATQRRSLVSKDNRH